MFRVALDSRSDATDSSEKDPKRCAGYTVYDPLGQKTGSAVELFVNREGGPEYIRVRIGYFGTKSVLLPVQSIETNEQQRSLALRWPE